MPRIPHFTRVWLATIALALGTSAHAGAIAPGELDPAWGGAPGGVLVENLGAFDHASDVVVQPDGRPLVLATTDTGAATTVTLSRYTASGAPDTTFGGGDGKAVVSTPSGGAFGEALLLRPDGRIVVVMGNPGGVIQMAVAQLTAAGDPDPAFNGGATLYLDPNLSPPQSITEESARAAVLLSDGSLVVGGQARHNDGATVNHLVPIVVKVSAAGVQSGFNFFPFASTRHGTVTGMAAYPDDRIALVGVHQAGSTAFNLNDPTRDSWVHEISGTTLGTSGSPRTIDLSGIGADDFAADVVVDGPGGAVLAGRASDGATFQALVARFGRDAVTGPALDAGFGSGGKVLFGAAGVDDALHAVRLDHSGRIVVEGQQLRAGSGDYQPFGARLTAGGGLDSGYGVGGIAGAPNIPHVLWSNSRFPGIGVAPDGRIVVATHSTASSPADAVSFARYGDLTDVAPLVLSPAIATLTRPSTATVRVTNNGDGSGDVVAVITFSQPVAGGSATVPLGTCTSVSTTQLRCVLASLAPATATDVAVAFTPTVLGPMSIAATVDAAIVDRNSANDAVNAAPFNVTRIPAVLQLWRVSATGRKLSCGSRATSPCRITTATRLRLRGTSLPTRVTATERTVRIGVFRKVGKLWVRKRLIAVRADAAGTYRATLKPLPAGTWRVRTVTPASATVSGATSAWRYVRVR